MGLTRLRQRFNPELLKNALLDILFENGEKLKRK